MEYTSGVILILILCLAGLLLAWSPGKPEPILDDQGKPVVGSLSEKIFININGVQQGMIIKSKNLANPVLLYIHGGIPDYFLTQQYPTGLEKYFTVVWWEMRGQGISFDPSISKDTMTTDQLVDDTLAVTNYLRDRFHQDRIYLMGHSGGTFYGIQAAAKAPELYHAYIAVAQISNQLESEKLAYTYMLEEFKKQGNAKMVAELEKAAVTDETIPLPASYAAVRDPRHAQPGHRHHAQHGFDRHRVVAPLLPVPGIHAGRKDRLVARQGGLRQHHLQPAAVPPT